MSQDLLIEVARYLSTMPTRTAANHRGYLTRWGTWLAPRGRNIVTATRDDIEQRRAWLQDAGYLPVSVKTELCCYRRWYAWTTREGLTTTDPMIGVTIPRASQRRGRAWLTRPEAIILLETSRHHHPSIEAAIHLWLLSGLRPAEPLTAVISDLGSHGDLPTLRLSHRKGGTSDTVPLAPETVAAIDRATAGRRVGPLLLHPTLGQAMSPHSARKLLAKVLADAGIDKPISPYGLRHTFITLALEAEIPSRDVATAAGHATDAQLPTYDRLRYALDPNRAATLRLAHYLHA